MNDRVKIALIEINEHLEEAKKIVADTPNMPGPAAVRNLANVQDFILTTFQHLLIAILDDESDDPPGNRADQTET